MYRYYVHCHEKIHSSFFLLVVVDEGDDATKEERRGDAMIG